MVLYSAVASGILHVLGAKVAGRHLYPAKT